MRNHKDGEARTLVFCIDPIEGSSYPVTETGYAMVYRSWERAMNNGDGVYVVYPDAELSRGSNPADDRPQVCVTAHRVEHFVDAPYRYYRSQREGYEPGRSLGSSRCHRESAPVELTLNRVDAVVFRQETGATYRRRRLLQALVEIEHDTLIYLSPRLALDPWYSSKVLPQRIAPEAVPQTFYTDQGDSRAPVEDKADQAIDFIRHTLGRPNTVIVKPLRGDNGFGICVLGQHPTRGALGAVDDRAALLHLLETHGDLVVQEYVPSIRTPEDLRDTPLHAIPVERRDFGEVRFLLIDGRIPKTAAGRDIVVARRVPGPDSLIADSGISYATALSDAERAFVEQVGWTYRQEGIHFGGGDLIRTPDPQRPFLFTDAARSVCGHAVVTGALNGEPYLIVDQVLDNLDHQLRARRQRAGTPNPGWCSSGMAP